MKDILHTIGGRKTLALILTAALTMMTLMAVPVYAAANTVTTTINCTGFTQNESGPGWTWVQSTKTLTLGDVDIIIDSGGGDAIKLPDGSTVIGGGGVLIRSASDVGISCAGNLTIGGTLGDISGNVNAIAATGDITISGAVGDVYYQAQNGIFASGSVTIAASGDVGNITGTGTANNGIFAANSVTINGKVGNISCVNAYGIFAGTGSVTIGSGTVVGNISSTYSYGISAGFTPPSSISTTSDVIISGTVGSITGGQIGILTGGSVTIGSTGETGDITGSGIAEIQALNSSVTISGTVGDIKGMGGIYSTAAININAPVTVSGTSMAFQKSDIYYNNIPANPTIGAGFTVAVWSQNESGTPAEGGPFEYTTAKYVKIAASGGGDITAPVLSNGSVNCTSDTAATIGFTTDEAGTAYYIVQNSGAALPTNAAVKVGTSLGYVSGTVSGKAVIIIAGPKDIYVVVEDAAGNISTPLKIEAAAYAGDPFKIGSTTYATLDDAVAAVGDGDVIEMLDDVTLGTRCVLGAAKIYTLDLGGYTIFRAESFLFGILLAITDGTVTIINGGLNGVFSTSSATCIQIEGGSAILNDLLIPNTSSCPVLVNYGTLSILGGNYSAISNNAIACMGGTVTIAAGTFTGISGSGYGCISAGGTGTIVLAPGSIADVPNWLNGASSVTITAGGGDTTPQTITAASYDLDNFIIGRRITAAPGTYTANDGGPAGTHLYQWYRATDASGAGAVPIAGANALSYTPGPSDYGKFICIETTPIGDGSLQGVPVRSPWKNTGAR